MLLLTVKTGPLLAHLADQGTAIQTLLERLGLGGIDCERCFHGHCLVALLLQLRCLWRVSRILIHKLPFGWYNDIEVLRGLHRLLLTEVGLRNIFIFGTAHL